jgi:hypothetical protein
MCSPGVLQNTLTVIGLDDAAVWGTLNRRSAVLVTSIEQESRSGSLVRDIATFSGEVVETDHLEEVSGLMANGSGSTWTDVHRELWVRPLDGTERRFTFINTDLPARMGHQVTLMLDGTGRPLALVNFSTQQYVNLVGRRQFELFGAIEIFAFAALLIGAGLGGTTGLVALAGGAAVYSAAKWAIREERYRSTWESVQAEIHRTIAHRSDNRSPTWHKS